MIFLIENVLDLLSLYFASEAENYRKTKQGLGICFRSLRVP